MQTRKANPAVVLNFMADSWNDLKLRWHSKAVGKAFAHAKDKNKYPAESEFMDS